MALNATSHTELIEIIKELKRKPKKIEYEGQEFGGVILDSITHWGQMPLDRFIELKGWEDLSTPTAHKDPRAAYGYLAEKGNQLYKELFELYGHLYIIAREGMFGDGSPATPHFFAPELPGQKLPRELPGWPDATVRLRVVNGKHMMITKGEGGSPARVRQPEAVQQLPTHCNPDIGALMKFMCGDKSMLDLLVPKKDEKKAEAAPKVAASKAQ